MRVMRRGRLAPRRGQLELITVAEQAAHVAGVIGIVTCIGLAFTWTDGALMESSDIVLSNRKRHSRLKSSVSNLHVTI